MSGRYPVDVGDVELLTSRGRGQGSAGFWLVAERLRALFMNRCEHDPTTPHTDTPDGHARCNYATCSTTHAEYTLQDAMPFMLQYTKPEIPECEPLR